MARRYIGVRIDNEVYGTIQSLAELTSNNTSEIIRFLLSLALSIIAPEVRLRDVIREDYVRELEKCNTAVLDLMTVDVLRVPRVKSLLPSTPQ